MGTRYRAALSKLDCDIVFLNRSGLSAAYTGLAHEFRNGKDGTILPQLLKRHPGPRGPYRSINLITYSAGYGFARELLKNDTDAVRLNTYTAIDSIHAGYVRGKEPNPAQLLPFIRLARRAQGNFCRFWIGHSDVVPYTYASTTEVAEAISAAVGGPKGGFYVRAYDVAGSPKREHGRALTSWGPDFVAESVVDHLSGLDGGEISPFSLAKWQDPSLTMGERAAEWSLSQVNDPQAREQPMGSNGGAYIAHLFGPATRVFEGEEHPIGITSGNWCAVAACYAERTALMPGERPILPYRVSGIELQKAAADRGLWRPAEALRSEQWQSERGDLVILKRGSGWQRHVCRVITSLDGGRYLTVGGNESNRWRITQREIGDQRLLGMIEYPRRDPDVVSPEIVTDWIRISDDVTAGRVGLDIAMARLLEDGEVS